MCIKEPINKTCWKNGKDLSNGAPKIKLWNHTKKTHFPVYAKNFRRPWMKLKFFFCQFPNPWTLRVSGMGGYTSKCEQKSKSLHPSADIMCYQFVIDSASYCTLLRLFVYLLTWYWMSCIALWKFYQVMYIILYIRVQWFWLFFTFWGITTHPWHPKGPRIWKLAKKNFQLHAWPAEIFGKNRKMRFLVWFQSLILGAAFDRSLQFFQHVLFMGSLIHIQNFKSLSHKL